MTVPKVIFANNEQAAHAVSRYIASLRPSPHRFALRPYQFQSPAFTDWWFIPSTDWPAYRYCKLFIRQLKQHPEYLHAGVWVEHGFPEEVKPMPDVKSTLVMKADWCWFRFLRHARRAELDTAMREVLQRSECPLFVSLEAYEFNRVPSRGEDRSIPDDKIEFVVRSPALKFEDVQKGTNVLARLNDCIDLPELAERLQGAEDVSWYWVDLLIGIKLLYGDKATGTWRASDIWRNALEPWTRWVR